MADRFDQLEMRRRELLLESQRLRADLAADHLLVVEALTGVERGVGVARKVVGPLLMSGAAAMLFRLFFRRRHHSAAAVAEGIGAAGLAGLAMRGLKWVTLARRVLTIIAVVRSLKNRRDDDAE